MATDAAAYDTEKAIAFDGDYTAYRALGEGWSRPIAAAVASRSIAAACGADGRCWVLLRAVAGGCRWP
jgi:hypothetical protein